MSDIGMNKRVMSEMKNLIYNTIVPKLNKLEEELAELKSKKVKK